MQRQTVASFPVLRRKLISCARVEFQQNQWGFSQTHKFGNIGSFVFPYIYIFFHYFNHMILVKVKLDVSGYKRIIFQDCKPHSYLSFLKVILTFLCCEEFVKTLLIRFHSLLVFTNIKNDTFCCLKYRHKIKEFHRSVSSVIQITKL